MIASLPLVIVCFLAEIQSLRARGSSRLYHVQLQRLNTEVSPMFLQKWCGYSRC